MDLSRTQFVVLVNTWLLGFSMFASLLNISPVMPLVKNSLDLDFTQTALIFSLPLAILAGLGGLGGFLADRIGPRRTAGIGALLLGVGDILRALSTNVLNFASFTSIIGVGLALCYPNLPKLIRTWFAPGLRGTASGVYGTGIYVGSTVALGATIPIVYPILGTWNGVFLLWGLISVLVSGVWWTSMRENSPEDSHRDTMLTNTRVVLRSKALWTLALIFVLGAMVHYVEVTDLLPFFVGAGASMENAALLQSLTSLVGVPGVIVIPMLSDRFRTRKPFLWVAAAISGASGFALGVTPSALVTINPILLGVTDASIFLTLLVLPIDMFPASVAGTASGLVISIGYTGGLIGPLVAGSLADFLGSFSFVPVFIGSFSGIIALLTLIAIRNPTRADRPFDTTIRKSISE